MPRLLDGLPQCIEYFLSLPYSFPIFLKNIYFFLTYSNSLFRVVLER